MVKILIAPDSFKDSLDAVRVARAIADGVRSACADAEVIELPIADGGEGTVTAMLHAVGGERRTAQVEDPLGRSINAEWGVLSDGETAIIELAASSGLQLLKTQERDPLIASTFGLGQLISAVLDAGLRRIVVGIGGSATVDGGAGMLMALGAVLADKDGKPVPRGGGMLRRLASICLDDLDPRIADCELRVACDVENPLVGPSGAARIFGPQKGATSEAVETLEAGLECLGACIESATGVAVLREAGCGAAGGVSAAFLGLLGARLETGSELILDAYAFDGLLEGADLVLTGEGKLDGQTLGGKAPWAVARRAREAQVPVVAVAGCVETSAALDAGFDHIISLTGDTVTQDEAIRRVQALLRSAGIAAVEWSASRGTD